MKRKYQITHEELGVCRLLDRLHADGTRTFKLKADKRDERWTEAWRGRELVRITDDGNGFDIQFAEGSSISLGYGQAGDLLALLEHIDQCDGNYFGPRIKSEIV